MAHFEVKQLPKGDTLFVTLAGEIDEDAIFPPMAWGSSKKVTFNFKEVSLINSCGVREWIKWLKTVPENTQIVYEYCPRVIVDQITGVFGFIRPGTRVASVYVPYYCENCDIQTTVLFTEEKELKNRTLTLPDVVCQKCRGPVDLNVVEAKYFKFLQS